MTTVLIVEDSPTMRSLLASTLEAVEGVVVREAASGFDALRLLPREKIDLIATDINMPDINGLELISYLRRTPRYAEIPLFIISTEGSEQDRERGLALGANEYLVKPFDPELFLKLVLEYTGRRTDGTDAASRP
jgi:two-component system chemotaxis response regulator CheY